MIEGRPSETALAVAAFRAAHRLDHTPVVFDDPLAGDLTSEEWRARLASPGAMAAMIAELGLLRIQGQVVGRARHLDERLEAAVAAGIAQYVLLGAGLDSFAWRRPDLAARLRVIEIDHPATQGYKRARLEELGLGLPDGLELVAADLERTSVPEALAATGFDPDRPAFFSWMGVVVYLPRTAFEATLTGVARMGAPGSRLLFDYPVPPALLHADDLAFSRSIAEGSAGLGERRQLKLRPEEVAAAAHAAGFELVEDLSPDDHFARYFAGRDDALAPCPEVHLALLRRRAPQ